MQRYSKALLLCDLWSLHKTCHKTCADIFPLVKCMPSKNNKKKSLRWCNTTIFFLYTRSEIIIISSQHHHASLLTSPKVSSSENILSIFQTSMQTLSFSLQGYILIQTYYLKEGYMNGFRSKSQTQGHPSSDSRVRSPSFPSNNAFPTSQPQKAHLHPSAAVAVILASTIFSWKMQLV